MPTSMPGPNDENLFANDARRQFFALKKLDGAEGLTKAQQARIHELRRNTRHLAIAELCDRLVREPRFQSGVSHETQREVSTMIQRSERQQREQSKNAARETTASALTGTMVAAWLATGLLVGLLLGGGLTYGRVSQPADCVARPTGAFFDTRTGDLVSGGETAIPSSESRFLQPAFYCWKCRQWLPTQNQNPQHHGPALVGPSQALTNRPVIAARPMVDQRRRMP